MEDPCVQDFAALQAVFLEKHKLRVVRGHGSHQLDTMETLYGVFTTEASCEVERCEDGAGGKERMGRRKMAEEERETEDVKKGNVGT